ncbi:DNA-binding transcriptional MocR family regulator [Chitinophaga skermanii]|uniref:DNA-binding transcriptional MocR family regulator n=1 Tax=Chitinophaga skermanii TaxID=331697 RepID=A0A327QWD4_9BACT|nr:PLP-dependent aminotransferase family protein [Chitinophaga skermanii]RAJ08909.1 DNA-binding transcriptional MocR family regulator [Chitinophaga skermanii]
MAEHLYIQVAERIEQLIEKEVIKIGAKLPSVRTLSKENGISISTAFQAYYHLENKGLIEPRPKSGYYVKFSSKRLLDVPKPCKPMKKASEVSTSEMIVEVFHNMTSEDIVRFSVAAPPDILLPGAKLTKAMMHAMRTTPNAGANYESLQGNHNLRLQIARQSINWGGAISEDDIIITSGCMDALTLCLSATTQPGDVIALESPAYCGAFQLAESLGLKVLEIPTHPKHGVDIEYLDKAIPKFKIKACIFVPNFNNPLGAQMPDENKKALVDIINKYDIALIEDDIYGDLYFGKHRPINCKSFDKNGNVLLCNSFSKSIAPGYRVGWTVPGKYYDKVLRLKLNHSIATATLPQAAIGYFLENGRYEHHLRNMRKALHTQCLRYQQAIYEYFPEDTCITRPAGGFVLWAELNPAVNTFELYEAALKRKISLAPGRIFSLQDRYNNCMRLSFGQPFNKRINDSLKTLGKLIQQSL